MAETPETVSRDTTQYSASPEFELSGSWDVSGTQNDTPQTTVACAFPSPSSPVRSLVPPILYALKSLHQLAVFTKIYEETLYCHYKWKQYQWWKTERAHELRYNHTKQCHQSWTRPSCLLTPLSLPPVLCSKGRSAGVGCGRHRSATLSLSF